MIPTISGRGGLSSNSLKNFRDLSVNLTAALRGTKACLFRVALEGLVDASSGAFLASGSKGEEAEETGIVRVAIVARCKAWCLDPAAEPRILKTEA